ncbi:MAG: multicopper oxidase domain-containing protein [Verrucomicrobia bacterium]|nr:multicopper oxidase domain-containing protein [Verrucomicrobiota bacterium]
MKTRRSLLKTSAGVAAGSVFHIGSTAHADSPLKVDSQFDGSVQNVPRWENSLPVPVPVRPLSVRQIPAAYGGKPVGAVFHGVAPEYFTAPAGWNMQSTQFHAMAAKAGESFILPRSMGLKTPIWGYAMARPDGTFGDAISPGPHYRFRTGVPVLVRTTNQLPEEISTHLHGGHWPSHSDGHASFLVLPGESRDYFYPNCLPLRKDGTPDITESPSSMWYHDHAADLTASHVARGMAGTTAGFDDLELGLIKRNVLPGIPGQSDENTIYNNPYDLFLALGDRVFHPTGTIWYDTNNNNGYLGNVETVNGAAYPRFTVEARKYRFRFLGASTARHRRIRLSDNSRMLRIGNDAWLFPKGQSMQAFGISPGKRVDVIIDFSRYQPGTQVFLENILEQTNERGPEGSLEQIGDTEVTGNPAFIHRLLRFDVVAANPAVPNASITAQSELRPHETLPASEVEIRRSFRFERKNGHWAINGQFYDERIANAVPRLGSVEEWTLENSSGGWWHPIHIHLESHQQVRNLTTGALPPYQNSFKQDVTMLGPNSSIVIRMRFRSFLGPFMFHCHNNEHEDVEMMFQFEVAESGSRGPKPVNRFFA